MRIVAVILALCWPALALAQSPVGLQALAAADALEEASTMLDQAEGARDRVKALTETIQAFEAGLGAMRSGLRQAAISEAQISKRLESRDGEVAEFLGVLQSIGPGASPVTLLHPDGPAGTARAGMLLAELTPALNRKADALSFQR